MYYTNEYNDKKFDDYTDCKEDLITNTSIYDYADRIDSYEILRKFFRKKSNEEFCLWLENAIFEAEEAIAKELITEHEDESEDKDEGEE